MELSASQTDYRLAIQSDNNSFSVGPYLNWTVTPFLDLNVSGGPTIYRFDASAFTPASTLTSYYFDFELAHQLIWSVSHRLSARRDVSLGYNQGNQYTELLTLSYAATWTATQNTTLGFNITYENGDQPLAFPPSTTIEHFDRVGIGADASYRFTEKLLGGVHYAYWQRASNISGNNYSENSISLQLNYNF